MIFTLGGTVVTLDKPAQYPFQENTSLIQAKERSASGESQVENFSVKIGVWSYNFINMSDADYTSLLNFFIDNAVGMLNPYDLTDDLGVTRTVRFLNPKLPFTSNSFGLWNGSFSVEEVS